MWLTLLLLRNQILLNETVSLLSDNYRRNKKATSMGIENALYVLLGDMDKKIFSDRTSPSEFIIPYGKYAESMRNTYSIGMRFRMRFEGEEASEQRFELIHSLLFDPFLCIVLSLLRQIPWTRFTGTVIRISDVDPSRWPGSRWRCLKVLSLSFSWLCVCA